MNTITDFYQFKYSRESYYLDLFINTKALLNIEKALDEMLSSFYTTKDEQCAYMRLKELFKNARESTDCMYAEVRMNKCYLKYIKNLGYYFATRVDYAPLKVLNEYLQIFLIEDMENIATFSNLNEDIDETKIREYIFFIETNGYNIAEITEENKYFLGEVFNTSYYFYYEKDRKTTLTHDTLRQIVKKKSEQYVIYADVCTLTDEEMNKLNVFFKKIPRDIKKF